MYGHYGIHHHGPMGGISGGNPWLQPGGFRYATGGPSIFGCGYAQGPQGMYGSPYQVGYKMQQLEQQWAHEQMVAERQYKQEKAVNTVKSTAGGALGGAAVGAVIGSVVPGIGTAVGAAAGAIIGGVCGLFKGLFSK